MLQPLQSLLAPPVLERLTIVVNHVIGAEPVAVERLRAHAGHTLALQLDDWPRLLPPPPPLAWRITPAGLLEWAGLEPLVDAELQVHVDAANPALLLAGALLGERPAVRIKLPTIPVSTAGSTIARTSASLMTPTTCRSASSAGRGMR